ncbi:HEAT repeat domain-containing protein [Leifsonia sp. NPDC056824]|uniref:HEAT repeat domain-containing protein n=1 Tax=Leifsonia sp. NPDC056824 TaxID=3345953 RepID=UPI00368A36FB
MVTFDEVFALAVEIGESSDFLPQAGDDLEAIYARLVNKREWIQAYQSAAAPLFSALSAEGIRIRRMADIRFLDIPEAIPVLIRWLPRVTQEDLKRDIISTLGDRRYFPQSKQALIDEFYRIDPKDDPGDNSVRFLISNVLARNAKAADIELMMTLAEDPRNGSARTSPIQALGRYKAKRALTVPLLMVLLDDDRDYVWAYAAVALGLLRVSEARDKIAERLKAEDHPDWIIDLKKALKRIDEAASKEV